MPLPPLPPRVPTNPGPVGNIPPPVTLPPSTNTQTAARAYRIVAARGWSDTGIDVQPGMRIEVTAKGTVDIGGGRTVDVNGMQDSDSGRLPVPQAGRGALLAKLAYRGGGESQILAVGAQNVLTVEPGEYGRLLFGINDDNLSDNRGEFTITIRW